MDITTTKRKSRYERHTTVIQSINTLDELLEYAFSKGFLHREDWKGWHPDVKQRALRLLELPECGTTEFDLKVRFDVLNPNRTARPNNIEHWINRGWTEADAVVHIKSKQKANNSKKQEMLTPEYWVRTGLTLQEAQQKAGDCRFGNTARRPEYWIKQGMSVEEAKAKVSQQQAECSPRSMQYWGKRGASAEVATQAIAEMQQHSADRAKEAWKNGDIALDTRNTNLEYWVKKANGDTHKAKQLQKDRQSTFSLIKCIEKLGPEAGVQRWKDRQLTWHKNFKKQNYSAVSQRLFQSVRVALPIELTSMHPAHYATSQDNGKNNELVLELGHSVCKPDFYIPTLQVIVEFDGTYWHRTDSQEYADECRKRDTAVHSVYPNMVIIHITEQHFKDDPEQCVIKIVDTILARHLQYQAELHED